ncbi:right-handed parallel beta-helix repeat-containing protein [Micromonospora sp. LOL_024]|uniref:right-handed parallel beta-helix repeat-containing protein n=1 Tax=Micromonospora sp. LOL_024 TaxID=3345412 RepID=UPI003A866FFE
MSDDVITSYGGPPPAPPPGNRRRKLWMAAGVAGLTGVVGLAALGGITARDQRSGDQDRASDTQPAAVPKQDTDGDPARTGEDVNASGTGWKGSGDRPGATQPGRPVPCDSDELIQAIEHANNNHGGTLELAKRCTYELTRSDAGDGTGPNGLPVITQAIVLTGHETKIVRAANADPFRILNVGRNGHLTLKNVIVKGGLTTADLIGTPPAPVELSGRPTATRAAAPEAAAPKAATTARAVAAPAPGVSGVSTLVDAGPADGAGILVQRGGHADLEHAEFVLHHAGGNGGAIANYGTARLAHGLVEASSAGEVGGGVFNASVLRVEESKITGNSAGAGGGVGNGVPSLDGSGGGGTFWAWKSTISHNRATGTAGGVLNYRGTTTLAQSEVHDNHSGQDGGGLVSVGDGQLALEQVRVAGNTADYTAGGVAVGVGSTAVIERSTIKDNVAEQSGGGLATFGGTTVLRDSKVVANRVVGLASVGGGIFSDGGQVRLERSKVADNFSVLPPGGIYTDNEGVEIDRDSAVTGNRPTNCLGSPVVPERCFG